MTEPLLCPDHKPVIRAAEHLDDLTRTDTINARRERARQCPQCWALNHEGEP